MHKPSYLPYYVRICNVRTSHVRTSGGKKIYGILAGLCLFLGAAMILAPLLMRIIYDHRCHIQMEEYQEQWLASQGENLEEAQKNIEAARNYNACLYETLRKGDSSDEQFSELTEQYETLLNASTDGLIGYIEIPSIQVHLPIYHGTSDRVLQKGCGHLLRSSLPVGGNNSHTVIAGHTGLPGKGIFDDLVSLQTGEEIYLYVFSMKLVYRITAITIYDPKEYEYLTIVPGKDLCSLVTCYPYGINSHRLVVLAERVEETIDKTITTESNGGAING